MKTRSRLFLLVVLLVVALGILAVLPLVSPRSPESIRKQEDGAVRVDPEPLMAGPRDPSRESVGGETAILAGAPSRPPFSLDLRELLRRIAEAERDLLREYGGFGEVPPDRMKQIEDLLAPILYHPDAVRDVIALLESGELSPEPGALAVPHEAAGEGEFSLEEWGAVRALYWVALAYNAPTSEVLAAGIVVDGRAIVLEMLEALPRMREAVSSFLLETLTEAAYDGTPLLDVSYLTEILALRARFPEHEELFSALFQAMGETMGPEERTAFFSVLTVDGNDPVMMGVALKNLLEGANPELALTLAEEKFASTSSYEMRGAIANAVASYAKPSEAARFLAELADELGTTSPFWLLGSRDDGLIALDTEYSNRLVDGADPRARKCLVSAMGSAPESRLIEIIDGDPDPDVKGQALLTMTVGPAREPSIQMIELVANRCGTGEIPAGWGISAASNLAKKARNDGLTQVKDKAIEFLRSVVENPAVGKQERAKALDALKAFVDPVTFEQLQNVLSSR